MNKKFSIALALGFVASFAALMIGCDRVKEFHNLIEGGTEALMKEDAAYRELKARAPERGEAQIAALSTWIGALNNLQTVMVTASQKLSGKNEQKIRADKDVQTALARFRQGVDEVLSRNYSEVALKLVPPWRLDSAQKTAQGAPSALKQISSYYAGVFATANAFSGKSYNVDVLEDTEILDTRQPCIDTVANTSKSQAKNSYCVSAARSACGHQIDLSCVQSRMQSALANNICPEVKTVTYKISAGEKFRAEDHIDSNTEEVKDVKYGAYVTEPNPDRNFGTFCPGQYDESAKAVLSKTYCYGSAQVRIYGYDQNRHVHVEIEGVRHSDNPRKDVIVDVYAEGSWVGARSIRPDFGWENNIYSLDITERAFQPNSTVRLQFRDLVDVNFYDQKTGQYFTKKAHWIIEAQIKGEDIPFIQKREVYVTKYTPNTWVSGIVDACRASKWVLKNQ